MSNIRIETITELTDFKSLKESWNTLFDDCRDDSTIYLTFDWIETWWKHFGTGKNLNILLLKNDDKLIGIIPLMKTSHRIGLMKMHILQTIGIANCNHVWLVNGKYGCEAMEALLEHLGKEVLTIHMFLDLSFVPNDSTFTRSLKNVSPVSKNMQILERFQDYAPFLPLKTTWQDIFTSLGKRRRKRLRRALRYLSDNFDVQFRRSAEDNLEESLNKFFELHQIRWQSINIKGIFSDPLVKEFYREVARTFMEKDWLYFTYLTLNDEMVCGSFGIIYNQIMHAVTAGRNTQYSKYSIGHIHDVYLIKDAITRNVQELDYLKGDEPYKYYWTKSARKYEQIVLSKSGLYPSLVWTILSKWLYLREIQEYGLRELYSVYKIKRREKREKARMGIKWLIKEA